MYVSTGSQDFVAPAEEDGHADRARKDHEERGAHAARDVERGAGVRPGAQQGLIGLRERAELLHGTLESGPTADGGYRVGLRIPLTTDTGRPRPVGGT